MSSITKESDASRAQITNDTVAYVLSEISNVSSSTACWLEQIAEDARMDGLDSDVTLPLLRERAQQSRLKADNAVHYDRAMRPIHDLLLTRGVDVERVEALTEQDLRKDGVVDVLINSLKTSDDEWIRFEVVRLLGGKGIDFNPSDVLLDAFEYFDDSNDPGENNTRWFLADALSRKATDAHVERVLEIVRNPGNGSAREPAMLALGRARRKRDDLQSFIEDWVKRDDGNMGLMAAKVLARWKATGARAMIQNFLARVESRQPESDEAADYLRWLKQETRRVLAKL